MLKTRNAMTTSSAEDKSYVIVQKAIKLFDWSTIKRVHIYKALNGSNEVDSSHFIDYLQANWPNIKLEIGEPVAGATLPKTKFDLIIVPLVAFDRHNNRLGRGNGWYDRFLQTQSHAMKLGLAYEFQRVSLLPIEPHDQPLDQVISA